MIVQNIESEAENLKANFFCDIGNIILNLIYPPVCCFCGTRLSPLNRIFVCDECANSLPYCRKVNRCTHCGKPIADGSLCSHCSLTKSNLKGMTAPFVYDGCAKSAVIAFKREQNAMNAKTLSLYVSEMIKYDFGGVEFDCVVSAPPRKDRMKSEKYDQAAQLARHVARRLSLPYFKNILYQKEETKKQSTLSTDERFNNVFGKFAAVGSNRVKDKTVLVIDDVCTTGATFEECARVLKECGAYRIYAASVATTAMQSENK